ncbi:MAG: S1 RNA-binding domain-containing protein [Prochloraceae cyanobacterium]|nr:S1 RNA-binding domain-containing protein [Prochloraceae cyanobacterium]
MTSELNRDRESNIPFSMEDFAKALEEHDYKFETGQVVRGKVFEYTSEGAYIDIGGKSPGFVPLREASVREVTDLSEFLPLQSEMEFLIVRGQNAEGQVTLSRRQLELKHAWDKVSEIAESDSSVQMRVTGVNKGGVIGEIEGLRGFIPRSHLIEKENLESTIGQLLTANFLEVDRERNKLILSQRQIARAAAIGKLSPGTLKAGKIVSIKPYGVFVDLEGVTGLLHIKQVSNSHVDSLTNLFKIGQEIKVAIVEVDDYKNRISLSTKILENYPGEILEKMDEVMINAEERLEKAREQLAQDS